MTPTEFDHLCEQARRKSLTPEAESRFRSHLLLHPEAQAAWEEEQALNELIAQLPDAPMPSNFTARVLAAVEREARPAAPARRLPWLGWLAAVTHASRPQQIALAAMAICVGLLGYDQYRARQRSQVAESLAKFAGTTALPGVEALRNFEAINRLGQTSGAADMELLSQLPPGDAK